MKESSHCGIHELLRVGKILWIKFRLSTLLGGNHKKKRNPKI
jgi:hypothetical protein